MEGVSTTAVIWGGDSFAAEKLENKLKDQGIKVIRGDYEEIPENTAYFFDFASNEEGWDKLKTSQKLVLIRVEGDSEIGELKNKLEKKDLNWRIVVGENVYGEGMEESGFLGKAFGLAARNKNLVLPSLKEIYRVLAVDDFIEAILRACFFSGTSGKILIVGGVEVNSKMVAEVLIDEAKMTKTQVVQSTPDPSFDKEGSLEEKISESKKLLRWEAETSFKKGAKEVIQYFVAKIDQENRSKKIENRDKKLDFRNEKKETRNIVEKRYEVEVEEETETRNEILETREEEEFKIERFKSPLPERKQIENRDEILENREEKIETGNEKLETRKISYWKWGMWGVGWIFLVVFLVNFIKIVTIPKKILGVETLIEKGKYTEATKEITNLSKDNSKWLGVVGAGKVGTILRAEGEIIDLLDLSLELAQDSEKISEGLFGESEVNMKTEIEKVEVNLDEAISKMGILQGRLSGQWQWLPGRFREKLNEGKEKLASKRKSAEEIRKILPILPEFLGLDGKRREYMVLLQNENELRATGGFIGSYAILSFEGGHWLGFEVKDIYEADGQLKGHVEPPEEIKKYLGEAAWFMRDANWQASFPLAAKDIQWFLEKETGRKVDGVIGLNLAAVKAVLGVTGELYVPDFGEKVNQGNLYEQAEYYSENKFFAGSVQKASFLGAVSKQLMEEIKTAKGGEGQNLLTAVMNLLDQNEVQILLNKNEEAKILAGAGWDGSIYEGKCNGEKCFADYLYIVESNFGVNKANYFLYRNIEREIVIGEKTIKNTLKIVYENTAKSSAWPGGDYKNYMRIYVPSEAVVKEINWSENGSGEKKVISGSDLKISQVTGKKEIGFLVKVPVGKKINVEINYTEDVDLNSLQNFSYLSYIQRQSGYGDTGMVTLISLPDSWQVTAVEPAASVVGGKLLFNQKLERDIKMGIEISR